MQIDLTTKHQLAELLAEPATVTQAHADVLAKLVEKYPYYQPLHLLLARAIGNKHHAIAALYNGGSLLHKVVSEPESLTNGSINVVGFKAIKADEDPAAKEEPIADEQETFEEIVEIPGNKKYDNPSDDQEVFDEIGELTPILAQPTSAVEEEDVFDEIGELSAFSAPIPPLGEEEIFEEIAEVDLSAYPVSAEPMEKFTPASAVAPNNEAISADELAIENIVATDFFAFEKSFGTEKKAGQNPPPTNLLQPEEYNLDAEAQTVSKYDDDKLPYTFLWWLAKTRKEHEQIFQPYVTQKKSVNEPQGALQQQYVEHIFHLQTPFSAADEIRKSPVNNTVPHKGDEIIETFIKNEPQIRAPKADQLNNENKAKKSAEDHNDLVSETLASIYIEQMLYHKAIETYEKLSLKFPEKSRYFADLIQSLEKKI